MEEDSANDEDKDVDKGDDLEESGCSGYNKEETKEFGGGDDIGWECNNNEGESSFSGLLL